MDDVKFVSWKFIMCFVDEHKLISTVFVTSERGFTFPLTCFRLVVFWVLHPAAPSTKTDSKESFSKSRVPFSSIFLFTAILALLHARSHTHTLTETCLVWNIVFTCCTHPHVYIHIHIFTFLTCTHSRVHVCSISLSRSLSHTHILLQYILY